MSKSHLLKVAAAAAIAASIHAGAARAEVDVHIGVGLPLPPPISFSVVPQLVVLPGTYVYAVPDYADELYYVDGYWWRPWNGRWYRSHYYDRDWAHYSSVPYFYTSIYSGWRDDYRRGYWRGERYDYNRNRFSYNDVERNWSTWKKEKRFSRDRSADNRPVVRDGNVRQERSVVRDNRGNAKSKTTVRSGGPKHSSPPKKVQQSGRSQGGKSAAKAKVQSPSRSGGKAQPASRGGGKGGPSGGNKGGHSGGKGGGHGKN